MYTGPFWYEIDHCLTDDYRKHMLKVAKKANYTRYGQHAKKDKERTMHGISRNVGYLDIKPLLKCVNILPHNVYLLHNPPYDPVPRHIDFVQYTKKTSSISWYLSPSLDMFAPVDFFDENENKHTYHYKNNAVILNTGEWIHSVTNNEHDRYMLQFAYEEPIDWVIENVRFTPM